MCDVSRSVVRVGTYSARRTDIARLLAWHGQSALVPHAVPGWADSEAAAVEWTLRQATLRALAVPPRLGARWQDIEIRNPTETPRTLLLRGELARFAARVVRGDIQLSVATDAERITAWSVLTRSRHGHTTTVRGRERRAGIPDGPHPDDETEVTE